MGGTSMKRSSSSGSTMFRWAVASALCLCGGAVAAAEPQVNDDGSGWSMRRLDLDVTVLPVEGRLEMEGEVRLRAAPRTEEDARLSLTAGDTVRVVSISDDWVEIEHDRGRGWTESSGVGVVD